VATEIAAMDPPAAVIADLNQVAKSEVAEAA
jgi:hypothetical protein